MLGQTSARRLPPFQHGPPCNHHTLHPARDRVRSGFGYPEGARNRPLGALKSCYGGGCQENAGNDTMTAKLQPREVLIAHTDDQPSKLEIEKDMGRNASFKETHDAFMRPVRIRHITAVRG